MISDIWIVYVIVWRWLNLNARDPRGFTPLDYSCWNDHVHVVSELADAGSNIDEANDDDGWSPVFRAIRIERYNMARLLIDRGAKVFNVDLPLVGKRTLSIPEWVGEFIASRSKCRIAAITIIGIHKYHRTTVTGNNDINVLKLVSKHMWSMRMDYG
jgi:ankyrin repeat protein